MTGQISCEPASPSMRQQHRTTGSRRLLVAQLLWGVMVACSIGFLDWYANVPGPVGEAPRQWPSTTTIRRDPDRPTLLMFIHPQCPCTRSSLEELARIMANCREIADVYAVFVVPDGFSESWVRGDLWQFAATIPDVVEIVDQRGVEARRFGAATSGYVGLYDVAGKLLFSGGITGARNHEGDNAGASAVYSWLRWGSANCRESFVFGCPLFD